MTFDLRFAANSSASFDPSPSTGNPDVFAFRVTHTEGDFAIAELEVVNTGEALLASGFPFAWISEAASESGTKTARFFGRLVAIPEDIASDTIKIQLVARPDDYDAQKLAVAAGLKVRPYWDAVWIQPDKRDLADTALESRPMVWHIDRTTLAVTASNISVGEGATFNFDGTNIINGTVKIGYTEAPLTSIEISGKVNWTQKATGTTDIGAAIAQEFVNGASPSDSINGWKGVATYTGQGLYQDWPHEGDKIGGGWEVGATDIIPVNGAAYPGHDQRASVKGSEGTTEVNQDFAISFPMWAFNVSMEARYTLSRPRQETMLMTLTGASQPITSDPSAQSTEILSFSTGDLTSDDIDDSGSPLADERQNHYLATDRGLVSINYLAAVGITHLIARARCVRISFEIAYEDAIQLSCRDNATITDDRIPGGTATGKIVAYTFGIDGSGSRFGGVTIACSVGDPDPAPIDTSIGTPVYVDADVLGNDVQVFESERVVLFGNTFSYERPVVDPSDDFIDYSSSDWHGQTATGQVGSGVYGVNSITITGHPFTQEAALGRAFESISEAVDALNQVHTTVDLVMTPIDQSAIAVEIPMVNSLVLIPSTINLSG